MVEQVYASVPPETLDKVIIWFEDGRSSTYHNCSVSFAHRLKNAMILKKDFSDDVNFIAHRFVTQVSIWKRDSNDS